MVGRIAPSEYFPDRAPTWTEVGLCVLVVVGFLPQIHVRSAISWPAVLVGFLATAVALGPGANSALGERVGQWFTRIGIGGRAVVIVLYAIGVVVLVRSDSIPSEPLVDVGYGVLLAGVLYVVAYVAWAGEVSGWGWETGRE
ncbi:hypothetical protein [Natronorubrum sp. FCH18a]|uniref:hypothetical protein n=1 Tax=Natronorubrum sp. FCH18a TaxID=3447018 RepID=UPI003F51A3BD